MKQGRELMFFRESSSSSSDSFVPSGDNSPVHGGLGRITTKQKHDENGGKREMSDVRCQMKDAR